jgi:hypothetical protein
MSATATSVTRQLDASGDSIKGFLDAGNRVVQGVVIDPEVGAGVLTRFATAGTGEVAILISAAARRIYQADVITAVGAADPTWLMLFNTTIAPVATDVPIWRARVGGGFASIDVGVFGIELTSGLGVALSTTPDTLTLAGANDAFFQVGWA